MSSYFTLPAKKPANRHQPAKNETLLAKNHTLPKTMPHWTNNKLRVISQRKTRKKFIEQPTLLYLFGA